MHAFLVSALAFLVLIALMVVVHEFGHFAVAKLCGVRVEAFSVGMGPRLFGVKYGETDYKVCLLPIGGFVKMTGELPGEEQHADDPGAFTSHPRWQRMLIGVAGPAANFVLAFVLMVLYFGWINEVPNLPQSLVEYVTLNSPADKAGIEPGDVVTRFGAATNPDLETLLETARRDASQTVPVTVERDGKQVSTSLSLPAGTGLRGGTSLDTLGLDLHFAIGPIGVNAVTAGSPAQKAGLRANDSIVAVDGYKFHSLEPLSDYLQDGKGKPVTLTVERDGKTLPPMLVHPHKEGTGWMLGFERKELTYPPAVRRPMQFGDAVTASTDFCTMGSTMIFDMLGRLLKHQVSIKQLSGPVGIAQVAGQAAETKHWWPKFEVAAEISLNLGILNLLPFPILDGGLIFFLLIESVMRHDISIEVKERMYQAALVVLVVFFVYVSYNDVTKLSIFMHGKP
ncbi:MAG TPA: RIP metalloprotease RseP [Terracidiphilus sp.]|nr:RIP metalloprotease RseP [Terracidiphilus sp.]